MRLMKQFRETTLTKQLDCFIDNDEYENKAEEDVMNGHDHKHRIIDEIRQNCIDTMIILCKLIEDRRAVRSLQNLFVKTKDHKILKLISKIISNKWSDRRAIKIKYHHRKLWKHAAYYNLIEDDMDYFFDKIHEIMHINYIPNNVDIRKHKKFKLIKLKNLISNNYYNQYNNDGTIWYKEKDAIKLFILPLYKNANIGFTINIPSTLQHRFSDPINGDLFIQQLKVRSIFNSKCRPYLIDCYVSDQLEANKMILSSSYILKKGDDVRCDYGVLQMFNKMNEIWKRNGLKYKGCYSIKAITYKCIPIGNDIGIIEMKSNCISLNKILTLRENLLYSEDMFHELIRSSIGAFIGGFVCGLRDRHYDNILINKHYGYLFNIDFGYIFGQKTRVNDAAKIAITKDLKQTFDLYDYGWNDFVKYAFIAWLILRDNANELIIYATNLFKFKYTSNEIQLFLTKSLKLNSTTNNAKKYIYNKLQNSPYKIKTKMKNIYHDFETLF